MPKEITEISNNELKAQIKEYRRIKFKQKFGFDIDLYNRGEILREDTDNVLESFSKGKLILTEDQYSLFAYYINVFAVPNREKLLDKLQALTSQDVRHLARMEGRPLWQKLLDIDPDKHISYMSAATLQNRVEKYNDNKRLEVRKYIDERYDRTNNELREEATLYINNFLSGKIKIKKKDWSSFRRYVVTLSPLLKKNNLASNALSKLKEMRQRDKEKSSKKSFSFKTLFNFNLEKLKPSDKTQQKFIKACKVITLGALLVTGVNLAKDCDARKDSTKDKDLDKTEIKNTPASKTEAKKDSTTVKPFADNQTIPTLKLETKKDSSVVKTFIDINKNPAIKIEAKKDSTTVKPFAEVKTTIKIEKTEPVAEKPETYRAAIVNHHNHALKMILGEKKKDKLLADVRAKIDNGIIALPNDMGAEEFAYALTMYKQYGVSSSLQKAMQSDTKLSTAENQKVAQDIIAAGDTGLGVQKMALELSKGKSNHKSSYNRASRRDQKQHNLNMKQLRQIRAHQSRAA